MEKVSSLKDGRFLIARQVPYPVSPDRKVMLIDIRNALWLNEEPLCLFVMQKQLS